MATDLRHDKKVMIDLDIPLTNIGRMKEKVGKYNHKNNTTVFHGPMEVSPELAEDLTRRQKEFHQYEQGLIRDNGHKDVNAGQIMGSQA